MMKETILQILDELGFQVEAFDENGYKFSFEGTSLLYVYDEDDEDFLLFYVPNVYECDDENSSVSVALCEAFNNRFKYVKAFHHDLSVVLAYETRMLHDKTELTELVSHIITTLGRARYAANGLSRHFTAVEEGDETDEEEDDTDFDFVSDEEDEELPDEEDDDTTANN